MATHIVTTTSHRVTVASDPITVDGERGTEYQAVCQDCQWSGYCVNTIEDGPEAVCLAAADMNYHEDVTRA